MTGADGPLPTSETDIAPQTLCVDSDDTETLFRPVRERSQREISPVAHGLTGTAGRQQPLDRDDQLLAVVQGGVETGVGRGAGILVEDDAEDQPRRTADPYAGGPHQGTARRSAGAGLDADHAEPAEQRVDVGQRTGDAGDRDAGHG